MFPLARIRIFHRNAELNVGSSKNAYVHGWTGSRVSSELLFVITEGLSKPVSSQPVSSQPWVITLKSVLVSQPTVK